MIQFKAINDTRNHIQIQREGCVKTTVSQRTNVYFDFMPASTYGKEGSVSDIT